MTGEKNILVPVDFEKASKKALTYASYLQKKLNGKIFVLHVSKNKNRLEDLHEKLKIFIESAKLLPSECTLIFETGSVTDAIIKAQKNNNAELIVMGTKGADTLGRGITGTNTYSVINKSQFPVIVIPESAKLKPAKTIVLATNNHSETLDVAGEAISIIKSLNPKLLVLHINPSMDRIAEVDYRLTDVPAKITKYIDYDNMEMHISSHKDIRRGIESFVKKHNADLLIMIPRHRSVFESVFEKSNTRQMVFYSDLPMMVIPS